LTKSSTHVHVLLVEDNPDDELLTLRALRTFPCAVHTVRDGEEAVRFLREDTRIPDLILLDLKLPKLSGHDVLAFARKNARTGDVPVIVFTSSREEVDVRRCYELGANSYLQKPVAFEEFMATIQMTGTYWLTKNIRPVS